MLAQSMQLVGYSVGELCARIEVVFRRPSVQQSPTTLRRLPHCVPHSVCLVATTPPLDNDPARHGSEEGRDLGCGQPDAYSEGEGEVARIFASHDCSSSGMKTACLAGMFCVSVRMGRMRAVVVCATPMFRLVSGLCGYLVGAAGNTT